MSGMEQEDFDFLEALNQRGTVFLARQRSSGRILVARQVPGGQTEIFETLRAMNAKHVPAVRAIEARQDGTAFVYEDYIQGVTLRQRMEIAAQAGYTGVEFAGYDGIAGPQREHRPPGHQAGEHRARRRFAGVPHRLRHRPL